MSADSTSEREPTRDELVAMAYVDGELDGEGERDARAAFEQRLLREPALAREVAELRRLEIAARLALPPAPLEAEWARLRVDRVQALLRRIALLCGVVAALGALALAATRGAPKLEPAWLACAALALVCAAAALGAVLRTRLRTRAVDPYVHVER
ncbi:MAG: hypothetical protein EPO68_14490 [Planctomycetota bacterium]|nr:MAG: hypothetical protein EPO68_14490 [Planctomycetota bacterium]